MKIKCFSHGDLDGVVSNLLMCKYFNMMGYGHSTETCSTGSDVDKKIKEYINSTFEYREDDIIIITDICMSYEVAAILDTLPNRKILIDHHGTSQEMLGKGKDEGTDFSWATIKEGDSATMMVHKYLNNLANNASTSKPELKTMLKEYRALTFVTDLWDTKSRQSPEFLNWKDSIEDVLALFNAIGTKDFKARFMANPNINLTEAERVRVTTLKRVKDNVMKYTNIIVRDMTYKGMPCKYGVCFSGLYRSEIAEYAFQNNPELMFVAIIDMNDLKGSFRRSNNLLVKDLDLTEVAKQYDPRGGGHPFACGFNFTLETYSRIIDSLLNNGFKLE